MKPARIFIVEDDRVVARDIQQQVAHIGHTVVGTTVSRSIQTFRGNR
jgi:hypothetical protein